MARIRISVILLAGIVSLFWLWCRQPDIRVSRNDVTYADGQSVRRCRVVIAESISSPGPLVVAFHGKGESVESFAKAAQLDRLAGEIGGIVAIPECGEDAWVSRDATLETLRADHHAQQFDVLLHHLQSRFSIDRQRISVLGMSNGGSMALALQALRPETIAAAVSHSGPCPPGIRSQLQTGRVLLIVGQDDFVADDMEGDAQHLRPQGVDVEFRLIAHLGHEWSTTSHSPIRAFLRR